MVASIVKWHRAKSMKNIIAIGEEKWIARYLYLKIKFYEMENVARMERVEVACDSYRARHGLGDDILVSEEEGGEEEIIEEFIEETDEDEDEEEQEQEEGDGRDGERDGEGGEEREDPGYKDET